MVYQRILLKLSGEALMGSGTHGIDSSVLQRVAGEIHAESARGVQVGLVIGGGNLLRGASLAADGMNRVSGDHMGMLATVINALAMQDALQQAGSECVVMSAITMQAVCEPYTARAAIEHLEAGRVVLFSAGTGNPFFTTDSAASLRAIETGADLMLKATKVNGVYSADPVRHPDAEFYNFISYDDAITQRLGVMDTTALVLCSENNMPLRVFNMFEHGELARIIDGENVGTLVGKENGK